MRLWTVQDITQGLRQGLSAARPVAPLVPGALLRAGLALVLLLGLGGCRQDPEPLRATFLAFGTEVEVLIRRGESPQSTAVLRELGEGFQRLHEDLHPWKPGALGDLNEALSAGGEARPGPELLDLIRRSMAFERSSDGHFNAAIGGLVSLWGFHTSNYPITAPPPTPEAIGRWLDRAPSAMDIAIRGQTVRSSNTAVRFDFSGMAKGWAAQRACDLLIERGFGDALVNLGGDVMLCSRGRQPWSIAISDGRGGVHEILQIEGPAAVFSSGTAQRWGEWEGARYAHLLDPTTGQALSHSIQATVINRDATLADAAATALAVAGPQEWRRVAASMGVTQALLLGPEGPIGELGRWGRGSLDVQDP